MGYDRPPREMHDATCGDCGKDCQVPFEPRQDKPVYCNDCFQDHKPARNDRGGGRFGGRGGGGYCLLYTSPSPRDATLSRMPSSA